MELSAAGATEAVVAVAAVVHGSPVLRCMDIGFCVSLYSNAVDTVNRKHKMTTAVNSS